VFCVDLELVFVRRGKDAEASFLLG